MRIGLIAPPWVPVPPTSYGGTEVVVDNLARGLDALGHEVTLFTVGESTCPVRREHYYPAAVAPMGTSVEEAAHVLAAYEMLDDVDVIHDHTILGPLLGALSTPDRPPVISTHHGVFTAENRRIFAQIARQASVTAISRSQASYAGDVPITAVVHHGIDLEQYRPGPGDGDYLIFIGRMSPDKGVDRAIRLARRAGRPLVIVTKIREAAEHDYFERDVKPILGPDDELLVEPSLGTRLELLGRAAALLNPIEWPEPFGLVMAEALATGTPVYGYPGGAAPEIIDNGRTGFLCHSEDELIDALQHLDSIDRRACRAAAEDRFSLQRMARDYAALYEKIVSGPAVPRRAVNHSVRMVHPPSAIITRD